MTQRRLVWLLATVLVAVHSKIVQVPSIQPEETLYLRVDQLLNLDDSFSSFGTLSRVHRKEVAQLKDGKEVPFEPCYEQAPSSLFGIDF